MIGRRDHAGVRLDGLAATDALEPLVLQDAQDFGLRGTGHVADFVEENCASAGLLELAHAPLVGPGEGASLVSEQFAFEKRFGNGGTVDGQQRPIAAVAMVVDGSGDEFLAGARLAQNQDAHVRRGHASDGLVDFLHLRRAADDRLGGGCDLRNVLELHAVPA